MKDLKFLNDNTKGRKIKSLEAREQALSRLKIGQTFGGSALSSLTRY